jgi:hypothetical protein
MFGEQRLNNKDKEKIMTVKGFMPQWVSVPVKWEHDALNNTVTVTEYERVHCTTVEEYKNAVGKTSDYLKQTKGAKGTNCTEVIPERARNGLSRSRKVFGTPLKDVKED